VVGLYWETTTVQAPHPPSPQPPEPPPRGLGHEVEVEELDELELDVARGRAAAEQRGDCEQAVLGLEGAGVARGVDECDDEGKEGGALDGWAVNRLDEVEEELRERDVLAVAVKPRNGR
jgi:hypothetical protein